jgi:2-iminobutanoate/2-iminopropanoate deaminase
MKSAVSTPHAPNPGGPYSQAVRAGNLLFLAGQIPIDPATGDLTGGDITVQARQALDNIAAVLKAGGLSMADVVRTTVFLADMNDAPAMNEIYGTYFPQPYPTRATVEVARLPRDVRIEIDAIAAYQT